MIELGKINKLAMVKNTEHGVYLGDKDEKVLLPRKQVPEGLSTGDEISVFVYRDSMDRLIATVNEPLIKLGEIACLKCKDVNKVGAFLDWGLEKDLFMPYKEQTVKAAVGKSYLVALYIDKSNRLSATMKIYDYLSTESSYSKDDKVTGYVYNINPEYGAFVAIDNKFNAMIGKNELLPKIKIGDVVNGRVTNVREDGKLDISMKEKAYIQMDEDAVIVLRTIEEYGGVLPFSDKASPEVIKRELNMSKNQFKRAVGRLLKEGKVSIGEKSIRRIEVSKDEERN